MNSEKLHHNGRVFGLLASIRPDEECQIAQIGKRLVVLPQDLGLLGYLGQGIGVVKIDENYHVRGTTCTQ
ncbi:MAG: hypothetical protein NTU95_05535 [Methanothrix sp.]|nr:hypothetical protein [Methanothrix sp.]